MVSRDSVRDLATTTDHDRLRQQSEGMDIDEKNGLMPIEHEEPVSVRDRAYSLLYPFSSGADHQE